jgi:DNA-binding MarR family transcriptional regulator
MSEDRPGFYLPFLLAGAFRALVDSLHVELQKHGHGEARPVHGFALQAIGPDGATISELGRRLGVSKQAAAKTARALEQVGYVTRGADPDDARATVLVRTARGEEMLVLSAQVFEELRGAWAGHIGLDRLRRMEDDLQVLVAGAGGPKVGDLPGWLR